MTVSFEDIMAELPAERRARIEKRAERLNDEAEIQALEQAIREDDAASEAMDAQAYWFELFEDGAGTFHFRLRSPAGVEMISAEGYDTRQKAVEAIQGVQVHASEADVMEPAE